MVIAYWLIGREVVQQIQGGDERAEYGKQVKGFAFVSRQKRMQFDDGYFYIDLVFYNCILKCYLLIDLKIGELAHQDVGQIDSYVRMYDFLYQYSATI